MRVRDKYKQIKTDFTTAYMLGLFSGTRLYAYTISGLANYPVSYRKDYYYSRQHPKYKEAWLAKGLPNGISEKGISGKGTQ